MKRITIILLLVGSIATTYGEGRAALDSTIYNMTQQLLVFPHEKIHLHTDKPYYITGEKIFFRAFLLNAISNKPAQQSRYVYVELINPADSVVQRLRIRPDDENLFHGAILLPEELPQGTYKIRAYTQYMRNQGESSFYSKYVKISDPQILSVQTESDFRFDETGKVNASLRFTNAKTGEVIIPGRSVVMRVNRERTFTGKPDKEGWIRVKLNFSDKANTRVLYVEMTHERRVFKQYIRIPYPEGDFDVSFYPEGGSLIPGQMSNVAFKAVNSSGADLDITGEVIDSKGNTVAKLKTFHNGMGEFTITPSPSEDYRVNCYSGNRMIRFDLPKAQFDAYSLTTVCKNNRMQVSINKYPAFATPELYLLIHHGGLVVYANAWDSAKEHLTFDATAFPSGINNIVLLTKDLQILSERLVFILNNEHGVAEVGMQKKVFGKREQIRAGISLKDGEQLPLKGNFSIAVTNDNEVIADTTSGIFSGILLRSELRGHIENPEYYFRKGDKNAEIAADLLMKTHGWRRYAIPDVIRGELNYPEIPFEESQKISGEAKTGLLAKMGKGFKVTLLSLGAKFYDIAETDENGRYLFQNFEFPENTEYVIQALNNKNKGRRMTELYVDEESFPEIRATWTDKFVREETPDPVFLDYTTKADRQYTYENGMRLIHLQEIEVTATYKKSDKNKPTSIYHYEPDFSFSAENISKYGDFDVKNLLYRVPGVTVRGNIIRIRNAGGPPLIVIDDMPIPIPVPPPASMAPASSMAPVDMRTGEDPDQIITNYLNLINVSDIEQLDVIKDIAQTTAFGPRGSNGVIYIRTKKGEGILPRPSYNIKPLTPLGYQLPVEFFSPRYDSNESIESTKPDLRTTIFWKPNVVTDNAGNAKLDFYTADDPATYTIIIEGVSDDGRLIHSRIKSLITVK